jgi:hypothetical protein
MVRSANVGFGGMTSRRAADDDDGKRCCIAARGAAPWQVGPEAKELTAAVAPQTHCPDLRKSRIRAVNAPTMCLIDAPRISGQPT